MSKQKNQETESKRQFRKMCEFAVHYQFCYCYLCGQPILEGQKWNLDHIKPRSKGGKTEAHNLRPTHYDCNQSKADLTIGQYRQIRQTIINQKERQK